MPYRPLLLVAALASAAAGAEEFPAEPAYDFTGSTFTDAAGGTSALLPAEAAAGDLQPPEVDAYVDVALTNTDFGNLGYEDDSNNMRILAGWLLGAPGASNWRVAAELGYQPFGGLDRTDSNTTRLVIAGELFDQTRNLRYDLDATSIDFGVRLVNHAGPVDLWLRTGLQYFHVSEKLAVTRVFTAVNPFGSKRADQVDPTVSSTDSGMNLFGALGVGLPLGEVTTLYLEQDLRSLGDDNVVTSRLGLIANF